MRSLPKRINASYFSVWMMLILAHWLFLSKAADPFLSVVMTSSGWLRGRVEESVLRPDIKFVSFLGIPYAKPPIGEFRFKKTVPVDPWPGVLDATNDANECLQINGQDESNPAGNEDCLYLNVFTPLVPSASDALLKPVIVYIHGGGFSKNAGTSGLISPDYLIIEHDIILVTMNYRLHLFGFLNLDIPECNGNMGLRDQTMALKWVHQNIITFGGDPNNVTLIGQSAGAHSAYLHMLSPMSRGLFHKVIMHSPIMPKVISEEPEYYSLKFAIHLGYKGNLKNRVEVFRFIDSFNGQNLMEAFSSFQDILSETDFKYWYTAQPFKPAIDAYEHEAFLPTSLTALAKDAPAMPIIMGSTSLDGAIAFFGNNIKEVISYVDKHLDVYLDPRFMYNEHVKQEVIAKVKAFYFNSERMDEHVLPETINLFTDLLFYHFDTYNSFLQASFDSNKIYNYHFRYDGSLDFYKKRYLGEEYYRKVEGAVHTQDLSYLFYSEKSYPNLELTDNDRKVIHKISKLWTNFAKNGSPNSPNDDIEIEWRPINQQQRSHLSIDKELNFLEERINEQRRQFWEKLLDETMSKKLCAGRFLVLRQLLGLC